MPAERAVRLQAVIDAAIVNQGAPGIAAAVISDEGLWAGSSGLREAVSNSALAPDAAFAIASITKTFVAALVLGEVEQGRLLLDTPAADYLPSELEATANDATIRQLLLHTSGIPEYTGLDLDAVLSDCERAWTLREAAGLIPAPTVAAGSFSYSNSNYVLLGLALERATGETVGALLRQMLDPHGLDRIVYQSEEAPSAPLALPHLDADLDGDWDDVGGTGLLPCRSVATHAGTAGGMAADAASLARWGWLLYGGSILDAGSLTEMTTTIGRERYGLGTMRFPITGGLAFGHTGAIPGYRAILMVSPTERVALVVLVNGDQSDAPLVVAQRLVPAFAF